MVPGPFSVPVFSANAARAGDSRRHGKRRAESIPTEGRDPIPRSRSSSTCGQGQGHGHGFVPGLRGSTSRRAASKLRGVRLAVFLCASLGAAATGLMGMYMVGSSYARGDQLARAERWSRDSPARRASVRGLEREADRQRAGAYALLAACALGVLGTVLARRERERLAAPFLLAGGVAPAFLWWPGLFASGLLLLAGALAVTVKSGAPRSPPADPPPATP